MAAGESFPEPRKTHQWIRQPQQTGIEIRVKQSGCSCVEMTTDLWRTVIECLNG
jgi:Fe-S cluster assembly iron-binding protein IscA